MMNVVVDGGRHGARRRRRRPRPELRVVITRDHERTSLVTELAVVSEAAPAKEEEVAGEEQRGAPPASPDAALRMRRILVTQESNEVFVAASEGRGENHHLDVLVAESQADQDRQDDNAREEEEEERAAAPSTPNSNASKPPALAVVARKSSSEQHAADGTRKPNLTWDFLEVNEEDASEATPHDDNDDSEIKKIARSQRKLEYLLCYGVLLCVDQVLTCVTVQPVRVLRGLALGAHSRPPQFAYDVAYLAILVLNVYVLVSFVGAAQVYHSLRLQTFMKLYVVVNIAEVLDRLLSSLGLDLFQHLAQTNLRRTPVLFLLRCVLCQMYSVLHSVLFYVRLLTISVAINSSNDALFTILISNNFVELKGSVFKRSTEMNLFQISCSDIVERFVLMVFMFLVGLNYDDSTSVVRSSSSTGAGGTASVAEVLLDEETLAMQQSARNMFLMLTSLILVSEVAVDWIKHSFIRRFNSDIREDVYDRFLVILAEDVEVKNTNFPAVCTRLGLPSLPLASVIIRVVLFDTKTFSDASPLVVAGAWAAMFAAKVALKQGLNEWSRRICLSSTAAADNAAHKATLQPLQHHRKAPSLAQSTPKIPPGPALSNNHHHHKKELFSPLSNVNRFEQN